MGSFGTPRGLTTRLGDESTIALSYERDLLVSKWTLPLDGREIGKYLPQTVSWIDIISRRLQHETWRTKNSIQWPAAKSPLNSPLHLHDLFAFAFTSIFLLSCCPIPFGSGFTFLVHYLFSPSFLFPFTSVFPYSLLEINKTRTL